VSSRARRFARLLGILSIVIRDPGLTPSELASQARISERTLFRDLTQLRRLGYPVSYSDGYQLQESLGFDGGEAPHTLATVYRQQLTMLRGEVPAELAARVEADMETLAPAALASLLATVLQRRLDNPNR
jgi:predicted DNA-binding transcriptional regulator YafY